MQPFGGTGGDSAIIMQELRHRVQNLERQLADQERDGRTTDPSYTPSPESQERDSHRSRQRRTSASRTEAESTREESPIPRRRNDTIIYSRGRETRRTARDREDGEGRSGRTRQLVIMGVTPFHRSILEVRLPKHFDKPTDMRYDGTQDPLEHLTAFEARMNLEGVGDEVRCRAFPVTLAGPAIRWFNGLPQGSIYGFSDISHAFLAQFTTRIAKAKHPINLLGITQRQGEPTRKYLDRFNDECLEIDGLTDSVASLCLTNGLLNENFRKHLTTKPPRPLKDRTGGNKNLYCDYHKGYGHQTQDCFDLKDALEQAIREGKLAAFSHLIREPRRRYRDQDEEGKTRSSKRRQEPEDRDHGLTVINVVTAKNAVPRSRSTHKKDAKVLAISSSLVRNSKKPPSISLGPEDQWFDDAPENPPMVITARVGTGLVKRILVDTGADSNIMFRNVFDALGLRDADLTTHQHGVIGLGDHFIKPDGVIFLPISVGQTQDRRSAMAEFVILRDSTAYNIILGRKTINDVEAIINTKLLVMKFVTDDGSIGSIRGDLETAVACDNASLSLRKKSKEASGVFLADLDARVDDKPRPEPEGDLEKFMIGDTEEKFTFINKNLPHELKERLVEMIRANRDLFAWTPADMPGIDPKIMSHHLAVKPEARPIAQRRRKMSTERTEEVARQTACLLEAGFIREVDYSTWLSNVVLVKKHNGKWRMCVDYSDLNKACPKDCFPLPNIDALVDAAAGYRYLSFMDAYSGYNQIPMHRPDEDKTAFITPGGTFCYKVMPFGLKNVGATYQRLMNRIFHDLIGKTVEVYVDDILAKTTRPDDLLNDLATVFASLRQHGMRLNPLKCAFAVEARKFLGFMITQRGVEANSEKCQAILQMKSPGCIKDVQRLAGRLTSLSQFLGASATKALPFFNLMKKGIAFEWTPACEEAFRHFKKILAAPLVLGKPKDGEPLYLYLAITGEALAAVLVREEERAQQPVYFVSRALQGAELRYNKLEKLALALLTSSRRLKQYFQGHQVVVRTDQGIRQVLQKPDLAGRMMTWSIELSQYDIRYEPRQAIKAQAMADFLVEVTGDPTEETSTRWKLHVDGASNQTFGGARIILESPVGVVYEQSIRFEFPILNNHAEYEALIGGLTLAAEVGATMLEICSDSQVVTSQVNGSYQAKDSLLQKYLEKVRNLSQKFEEVTVHHVPRERNTRADLLSKLASTKPGEGNRSLIQGMTREPAVTLHLARLGSSWLDPITNFLENGKLPDDEKDAVKLRREAAKYAVIQGQLFKKGFNRPLLKCLHPDETDYILRELHEGCCGHHIGGKALARKLIRAGYYWPSMMADSKEFVKKCVKCQENANFHRAPASELSLLTSSRPFSQWGVDLLGPFPVGPGQVKYLIVTIDYYTKWIEAEPLASISSSNCRKFMWRQVITRFGIPEVVISDNGTQFTDKKFTEFLTGLGIRQKFFSVEHPQTNRQVESANKIILLGLKKRLDNKKGAWADELASVLWSYRTTEQSSTKETPFRLTYGLDAVIPVEIGEPSPRLLLKGVEEAVEKDLIDEAREMAHLTETALKQRMALRYNTKVLKREFEPNDLVLRRNDIGPPTPGADNPLHKRIHYNSTTMRGTGTDHPGSPSTAAIANGYTKKPRPDNINDSYKPITVNRNDNTTRRIRKY
ncbi:uncharacterized protein LOC107460736 [Arachis duranensis]|uniref:Uncharacterized protein LOC107460736 n=1 Tax=Arachis duranensis TaxID=130453 RepID=A0A9C6TIZ7_ARADU|nr:uncharacterized protein LOC107460736 [Arachis duranensis]